MAGCGKCHRCGGPIRMVLDGEEYCPQCGYQRPWTHGWSSAYRDYSLCPVERRCPSCGWPSPYHDGDRCTL